MDTLKELKLEKDVTLNTSVIVETHGITLKAIIRVYVSEYWEDDGDVDKEDMAILRINIEVEDYEDIIIHGIPFDGKWEQVIESFKWLGINDINSIINDKAVELVKPFLTKEKLESVLRYILKPLILTTEN